MPTKCNLEAAKFFFSFGLYVSYMKLNTRRLGLKLWLIHLKEFSAGILKYFTGEKLGLKPYFHNFHCSSTEMTF